MTNFPEDFTKANMDTPSTMDSDMADDGIKEIRRMQQDFVCLAMGVRVMGVDGAEEAIIEIEEILIRLFAKRWRELREISGSIEWQAEMPTYFAEKKPCNAQ